MGEDTLSNVEAAVDSEVERLIARHMESMRERIDELEQQIKTMENSREGEAREGARDVPAIPSTNGGGDAYDISQTVLGGGGRGLVFTRSSRFLERNDSMITNEEGIQIIYNLPESTFSMMITEKILSFGFVTSMVVFLLAMTCLFMAHRNQADNGRPGNPLGLPPNVQVEVRVAQYLMLLVGVFMEHEIPDGLEMIGKGMEQILSGDHVLSMRKILLSSLLRLCMGYMFLLTLFVAVAQSDNVLDLFFNVLALEFVENIDSVIFALSRRGFFGSTLRKVADRPRFIVTGRETYLLRRYTKRLIRITYAINIIIGLSAMLFLSIKQQDGSYRCKSVTLSFGDQMWDDAYVGGQKKLLIFSHFNGIYEEVESADSYRPRYVERNKVNGDPFKEVTPAEIMYCQEINSWVFRHDDIHDSNISAEILLDESSNCNWLLKSQRTESFNLIELADESEWYIWSGRIIEIDISIECNDCDEELGKEACNYHGNCRNFKCTCDDGYYGHHCEFQKPCDEIRPEKDENTTLKLVPPLLNSESLFSAVYGRPVYYVGNLTGKPMSLLRTGTYTEIGPNGLREEYFTDDFFEQNNKTDEFQELLMNYTFVLRYTGRRWYGDLLPPGVHHYSVKSNYQEDYHAFWDNSFSGIGEEDNSTMLISAPAIDMTPVGIDFFEMRRRNVPFGELHYDYGPMGVLVPLIENEGSGFFHCTT